MSLFKRRGLAVAVCCGLLSLTPVQALAQGHAPEQPSVPARASDEALAAPAQPSVTQRGPIEQHGRWYTDGDGRAFLTAGVNVVYKHDPYTAEAAGFDAEDAQWLQDNGFDSVRLGVMWKAVEPQPGVYDDAYLESIARTVDELSARGIAVLIDAHQDMYNERFEGEFAPDWAVIDDGLPSLLKVGFPTNQAVNIGLLRAYDNFLSNAPGPGGVGLQDRYAAMWGHVAGYFQGRPGIMGYDVMNEPWPGSAYPLCYLTLGDCGEATGRLDALHEKAARAMVEADPRAIVHYEPYSMWNTGIDTRPARPASAPQASLSWHVYCTTNALLGSYAGCDLPDSLTFDNAERTAAAHGSALLLSEFGATDDAATLDGVIGRARERLIGWQYWSYCGCDDPTTQNQREQGIVADPTVPGPVTADAVNTAKLAILAAPHVRAVAGTPTEAHWDAQARTYVTSWDAARVDGRGSFAPGAVSEVAVPAANYPAGYTAEVAGGRVVSEPNATRLLVESTGQGPVTVTVRPR
ncbi:cellulase family glycosylhydrolase [Corynebacterium mastitidis]|uniref:cellulase family glycosylhydrolase n=1 Tax=Corynebacterium mastitidis TaxID=161890 RepID=UPI0030E7E7FA